MMKRLFERDMTRTKQTARKRTGPEPTKVWVEAEVGASAASAPTPKAPKARKPTPKAPNPKRRRHILLLAEACVKAPVKEGGDRRMAAPGAGR